jgi:hypothetical protein
VAPGRRRARRARGQAAARPDFQANVAGTNGASGQIDGDRLVYQQFKGHTSNILFFDLEAKHRSNPPPGVNTHKWEYWPKAEGNLLLFARLYPDRSTSAS